MQQMKGVSISQGLAVGKIVVLTSAAAPEAQTGTPEEELARFQRAQQQAVRDLGALYEKARAELGEAEAEIFSVHQLMAEDEDFADLITAAIAGGADTFMSKGKAKTLDAKLAKMTKWFSLVFVVLTLVLTVIM